MKEKILVTEKDVQWITGLTDCHNPGMVCHYQGFSSYIVGYREDALKAKREAFRALFMGSQQAQAAVLARAPQSGVNLKVDEKAMTVTAVWPAADEKLDPTKDPMWLLADHMAKTQEDRQRLIDWIEPLWVYPHGRHDTILVLRGPEGSGKTLLTKLIGKPLKPYMRCTGMQHLPDRFNLDFRNCPLLVLNWYEPSWPKKEELIAKYATSDRIQYESKNCYPFSAKNHLSIIVTAPALWLPPEDSADLYTIIDVNGLSDKGPEFWAQFVE